MAGALAEDVGEHRIHRRHAGAGVDDEQADIRLVHRALRQTPHAGGQRVSARVFEPRRVDHGEAQIGETARRPRADRA